jgi:hypothetical protein
MDITLSSTLGYVMPIAASFVASFIGAGLAARFALYRFYQEKVWERKAAAYTAIFEALHDMSRWFDAHIGERTRNRDLSEDAANALSADYMKAQSDLQRRVDSEVWLIPEKCRRRIDLLTRQLAQRAGDWDEMLGNGETAITTAVDDLRRDVRADLSLERDTWVKRAWRRVLTLLPWRA